MGQVGAQAELLFAAEPATDIGGQVAAAAVVGGYGHRTDIREPLGHVVDQATRLADAALQAGKALSNSTRCLFSRATFCSPLMVRLLIL